MSTSTDTRDAVFIGLSEKQAADLRPAKAWVAKGAKQPMVLERIDLGPLGAEDVEVAVEHCGLCHSDLSVFNNEWGISQYPAILGMKSSAA
jgi:Zn-dependent alcohol dehydrogenase